VAIYNLRKRSPHLGREGFFHWKQHVATFLENHWNIILGPQMYETIIFPRPYFSGGQCYEFWRFLQKILSRVF
jgi:hypothetical protein